MSQNKPENQVVEGDSDDSIFFTLLNFQHLF